MRHSIGAVTADPRQRAFVLQLNAGVVPGDGGLTGRIEHVASGQAIRFASTAELMAFLTEILAGRRADASEPTS